MSDGEDRRVYCSFFDLPAFPGEIDDRLTCDGFDCVVHPCSFSQTFLSIVGRWEITISKVLKSEWYKFVSGWFIQYSDVWLFSDENNQNNNWWKTKNTKLTIVL